MAEEAELTALITQHWAASSVLSVPETTTSPTLLWPVKFPEASKSRLTLAPKSMKAPQLITINGCKLQKVPDAPYPLSYDQVVLDSDICDRITLKKLCRNGLTLHEFGDNTPDRVLDIGTGAGNWIIEAAETWRDASSLVGFDLIDIQPPLSLNGPLASLNGRVKWVQGNALKPFPFETDHFDLVRICRIALGVPENKWNHLIEEAVRVLKPNGIMEIIEEDIIFPCKQSSEDYVPPIDTNVYSTAASISIYGDHDSSGSSAADHSSTSPISRVASRRPISVIVPRTLSARTRSRSLGSQSSNTSSSVSAIKAAIANAPVSAMPQQQQHLTYQLPALTVQESERLGLPLRDPRDHGILNTAWHGMLDDRFISPKPTSLLSLYLSFHLQSIRSHEPIQVVAPQPSYISEPRRQIPSNLEEGPYEMRLAPMDAAPSNHSRSSGVFTTREASMHLRRCLQVVLGCREALWDQVRKAYPTMAREYFDWILHDFELDMLDRIDTRSALKSNIGWDASLDSSDLVKWRDRVAKFPREEVEPPLICRTIRGFVGVKAPSS